MRNIRVSAFIIIGIDLIDIRINLRVFSAIGGELFHEILGALGDAFELDSAIIPVIAIGELTVSDGAQERRSSLCGPKGAVHLPRSALQRFSGGVRFIPLDGRAVRGHLAVPRKIVALLVHVEHRGSLTFPAVTGLLVCDCGRVVHHEVLTDIHAAIGAHMRFETAVRHKDAAKHCGCRIVGGVLGFSVAVTLAVALIGHAAANGDIGSVLEVPHDLLSHRGVQLADIL